MKTMKIYRVTLFVFVFGQIVAPNIRIQPNIDNHIFGTALLIRGLRKHGVRILFCFYHHYATAQGSDKGSELQCHPLSRGTIIRDTDLSFDT